MTDASPAGPNPEPGLGTRAARGAVVSIAGQGAKAGVQMIGLIVLARLLSPADYGVVALTALVVGVGEILRDFGLSTAAVQAPTLSREQRNNLFWINLGIGAVLAALVVAAAPLMAQFFGSPQLTDVMRALSLTFLLNGAATQYRASLERDLQFRRLALVDASSPVLGLAVAVVLALTGAGVWSLVAQQLTTGTVLLVLLVVSSRWWPGRPRRDAPMRPLLRFGWGMVGNQLVGYAANNVDSLVIGWRFGVAPLGIYNRAFQLLMQPYNQIRVPVTRVAIPILSRLQDQKDRYWAFLLQGQIALGYTLCLGLLFIAGSARPVTHLLLGEQWMQVAPLLALLAIAASLQSLATVASWVYITKGLTGHLFTWSLISAAIKVACVVGGSLFGLVGVAAGYAAAPLIAWPLSFLWLNRKVELPLRAIFAGAARMSLVGALAGATSYAVDTLLTAGLPDVVAILLNTLAGLAAASLALVLPSVRADVASLRDTARMLRKRS